MIRLRKGDCGFVKRRNGIPVVWASFGMWRFPVTEGNGRESTLGISGLAQTTGPLVCCLGFVASALPLVAEGVDLDVWVAGMWNFLKKAERR